jgi:uncharacterized RDD family membrane protein YckC
VPAPPLRRRLASLLYESLVAVALMLLVVALFSLVTMAAPALPHKRPLLLASCFAAIGGYFTYCWHNGQTLAMRAWKLRIEALDGRTPGWGRSCVRFVLAWVWVAPPLALVSALKPQASSLSAAMGWTAAAVLAWMLLWSLAALLRADRQFWHDAVSGTRLVPA